MALPDPTGAFCSQYLTQSADKKHPWKELPGTAVVGSLRLTVGISQFWQVPVEKVMSENYTPLGSLTQDTKKHLILRYFASQPKSNMTQAPSELIVQLKMPLSPMGEASLGTEQTGLVRLNMKWAGDLEDVQNWRGT